jgi:DNA-binding NtrC family response regulator
MKRPSIIVFDSDTASLLMIEEALVFEGYAVRACHTFAELGALVRQHRPGVIIMEHPSLHTLAEPLLLAPLSNDPETANIPVIFTTTNYHPTRSTTAHLHERVYSVLTKPFDLDELYGAVARALGAGPASPGT